MEFGIVGAGVVGLSIGYELADAGHDVTIIDGGPAGGAASSMNAGWVAPFLSTPRAAPGVVKDAVEGLRNPKGPVKFRFRPELGFAAWGARFLRSSARGRSQRTTKALQALASHAPAQLDALHQRGVAFESHADGLGVVFQREEHLAQYEDHAHRMRLLGYTGRTTTYRGADITKFDPAITPSAAGVLHLEDERHVRPETLTDGLAQAIVTHGGTVMEYDPVVQVGRNSAGRWSIETAGGYRQSFDQVIMAAGVHSRTLLKPLGIRLPLEAAKGVSLTAVGEGVTPTHPLKLFERMVASSPYDGNALRVSGTFDVADRTDHVDQRRLDMVVNDAQQFFASWRPTQIISERAGHRPTSADDAPLIGPMLGHSGLYVATGHGTLGVTLGPITGALVAQELISGTPEPLLEPLRPNRFKLVL